MVTVSVKANISDTLRYLDERVRKQIPFATALALTKTAQRVHGRVIDEMKNKFDRPTPFTLKSLYVSPAKKQNLQAAVFLKDRPAGKNPNALSEILNQQFAGGGRIRKRLEMWLQRAGYISSNEFVAPGAAAKLDRYGNISSGQVQQILSQLRAGPDAAAYASNSARSQRSQARAGKMFWSRGGKLPRGVWMRVGAGVKPVLLVISTPAYQRRINLDAIADKVVAQHFDAEFKSAFDMALRTAR